MRRHEGRSVIISGGTSGIGLACAERMHAEGAQVWILGTRDETVSAALAILPEGVRGSVCDVSDEPAVDAAVAEVADAFGGSTSSSATREWTAGGRTPSRSTPRGSVASST